MSTARNRRNKRGKKATAKKAKKPAATMPDPLPDEGPPETEKGETETTTSSPTSSQTSDSGRETTKQPRPAERPPDGEQTGKTDPADGVEPAPNAEVKPEAVDLDDLMGQIGADPEMGALLADAMGSGTPDAELTPERLKDRMLIRQLLKTSFMFWAFSAGDETIQLAKLELEMATESYEDVVAKHFPGLLQKFGVEVNALFTTLLIFGPRLMRSRPDPDPPRPEPDRPSPGKDQDGPEVSANGSATRDGDPEPLK